ncbi:hypothetical protein [Shewanella sp. MBTL60-007]|nr:hypothetical protein [Shewanella sp. MBTL60-007]
MSKKKHLEQNREVNQVKGVLYRLAIMLVVLATASFIYNQF